MTLTLLVDPPPLFERRLPRIWEEEIEDELREQLEAVGRIAETLSIMKDSAVDKAQKSEIAAKIKATISEFTNKHFKIGGPGRGDDGAGGQSGWQGGGDGGDEGLEPIEESPEKQRKKKRRKHRDVDGDGEEGERGSQDSGDDEEGVWEDVADDDNDEQELEGEKKGGGEIYEGDRVEDADADADDLGGNQDRTNQEQDQDEVHGEEGAGGIESPEATIAASAAAAATGVGAGAAQHEESDLAESHEATVEGDGQAHDGDGETARGSIFSTGGLVPIDGGSVAGASAPSDGSMSESGTGPGYIGEGKEGDGGGVSAAGLTEEQSGDGQSAQSAHESQQGTSLLSGIEGASADITDMAASQVEEDSGTVGVSSAQEGGLSADGTEGPREGLSQSSGADSDGVGRTEGAEENATLGEAEKMDTDMDFGGVEGGGSFISSALVSAADDNERLNAEQMKKFEEDKIVITRIRKVRPRRSRKDRYDPDRFQFEPSDDAALEAANVKPKLLKKRRPVEHYAGVGGRRYVSQEEWIASLDREARARARRSRVREAMNPQMFGKGIAPRLRSIVRSLSPDAKVRECMSLRGSVRVVNFDMLK